jgi:hypothetical protein
MTEERREDVEKLTDEELERQQGAALPDREVMTSLQPPIGYQPVDPLEPLTPGAEPQPPEID